jgi:hypothetical protein
LRPNLRAKKGLRVLSHFRSFKALIALAAIAATTLLAGCGGGGAKDPFDGGPPPPSLVVNPTSLNVYSNLPSVVTISSGVGPFQIFSSDSVVLPVSTVVSGALVTLVPSNVAADTVVTVTVQDALGRRVPVAVTVKPATLVGSTEIVPLANSTCGAAAGGGGGTPPTTPAASSGPTAVCTGETATAKVTVRAANTSVIPNRQVRFDVVFGNFQFVTDANGTNPSNTVTLVTDQNGVASALIKTADAVPSQAAAIRVTDLVTGNRVDTTFTIVQKINGAAVMSVVPGGYTGKAFFKGECGGTSGDFLIYGGRPPYTARSSLPNAIRLSVGGIVADPVTVVNAGGSFRASTTLAACAGYKGSIVVTDSAGFSVTVTYEEQEGSEERPAPPPPTTLVISPKTVTLNCTPSRTVSFSVVGGVGPFVLRTGRPAATSVSGTTVTLSPGTAAAPEALVSGDVVNVEVTDSRSNQVTATITCS